MGIRAVIVCVLAGALYVSSCNNHSGELERLPYLGGRQIRYVERNGERVADTVYECVPGFRLTDQDSMPVTDQTLRGRIYVADFIFLNCPTICPKMTGEMEKVYRHFRHRKDVAYISYSIDPENDSIPRLKTYAESLGAQSGKWYFVTGDQQAILTLAEKGYYGIARKDAQSPGGYAHSGGLLLVDKGGHIRGVYDGTNSKETERLIADISRLVKETKSTLPL